MKGVTEEIYARVLKYQEETSHRDGQSEDSVEAP